VYYEESDEDLVGLENHLQRVEEGGDDEVPFLLRTVDLRVVENRKRLKLTLKIVPSGFLISEVLAVRS
jgi:hypothetical protein